MIEAARCCQCIVLSRALWVEAWRPRGREGAARAEQWRPRSVALCIVVAGAAGGGWSLYWPRHRHCPASLLCRQWPGCAPGAPHRPAPPHTARTSIVSGDGRLPPTYTTLYTASPASTDHTAPPVVTRLTSTQQPSHCRVREQCSGVAGPGPAPPVFSCRSGGVERGLKAVQWPPCYSSTVAAVASVICPVLEQCTS